jgi:dTDP-4-amino-4,6-dideoxygalactose transaminase
VKLMAFRVPRYDPARDGAPDRDATEEAIARVLKSGVFVGGEEVAAFEREVAEAIGVDHAVSVGSGTDALTVALRALLGPGGGTESIATSPISFVATASAIVAAGYRPVFLDVNEETLSLDPAGLNALDGPDLKAVISVDIYGRVADVDGLLAVANGRPVIEDACQSFGARDGLGRSAGTRGAVAAFSFFPTKPLGGLGDGGLIATRSVEIAERGRLISRHGARQRYVSEVAGMNSRLDALQAAILRARLKNVETRRRRRLDVARCYRVALGCCEHVMMLPDDNASAWHAFPIRLGGEVDRDRVVLGLRDHGVEAVAMYPVPLHYMLPFATGASLPRAERWCASTIALPIWSGMNHAEVEFVADVLVKLLKLS